MKRIIKIAFTLLLILLTNTAFTSAQEKKEKQQIKVIVADKEGKQVVIDTTINTFTKVDSIRLKDGKVLYIGKGDDFSTAHISTGEEGNIIVVRSGTHHTEGKEGEVMAWVSADDDSKGKRVVYIHEGKPAVKDGEVRYNVEVRTRASGEKVEKTSYVVAKNGIVVTIEGGDEEKVKEIAGIIESKLGISKDDKSDLQEVKEESKKTVKK